MDLNRSSRDEFSSKVPIGIFGISAGTASQALMWANLATVPCMQFLGIPKAVADSFWFVGVILGLVCFFLYSLKVIRHFPLVRYDFRHPFRSNFFFVPILTGSFLLMSVPKFLSSKVGIFCVWAVLGILSMGICWVKVGEWFEEGIWRKNPAYFLITINPILLSSLSPQLILGSFSRVMCTFLFATGMLLYGLLFLSFPNKPPAPAILSPNAFFFPPEAEPLYFFFQAPPFASSISLSHLEGSFGAGSKFLWGIGLFLGVLVGLKGMMFVRLTYSLSWWGCVFPCASAAIATMNYGNEMEMHETGDHKASFLRYLAVFFSFISFVFWVVNVVGTSLLLYRDKLFVRSEDGWREHDGIEGT